MLKKIIVFFLTFIFSFTLTGKEKIISSNIKSIQNKTIETIKHLAVQSTEDIENPDEIFNNAIEEYKEEFNDYLNITGLNVQDKEAINLSNFDINYIAPEFYDIMHDYQITLESSLTPLQLEKYDLLRKQDYNFDRYVTLNEIKFTNLNPSLKYDHTIKPTNPLIPITPLYPTFSDFENEKTRDISITTNEIIDILTNCGLTKAIIAAFSSCISMLTTALSSTWIPIIGWGLAILLVTGALIGLTTIIVKNWNSIKLVINDIKSWFLKQFSSFASYIESFFDDTIDKGNESLVAERQIVGIKELVWRDALVTNDIMISIATEKQKNKNDVLLMKNIVMNKETKKMNFWIADGTVSENFVVENQLYSNYFISTYTWYNNTAKRMLYNGATKYSNYGGYGYKNLIYDRFDEMKTAVWGWNHYHIGKYNPIKNEVERYEIGNASNKNASIRIVHSFFGLTYIRKGDNSGFDHYPNL